MANIKWYGRQVNAKVAAQLRRNVRKAGLFVQRTARENVTPGGASGFRTTHGVYGLFGSIQSEVIDGGMAARIGSSLRYARIHELGGVIRPKTAQYLRFVVNGKEVFTKQVTIPARPYLRPAIDNNGGEIRRILSEPMRA